LIWFCSYFWNGSAAFSSILVATKEDYILIIIDPFTTLFYTLCLLTILQIIFPRVGQEILYMQILEGRTEVKAACQKS
jgi:hypothetical protein